MWFEAVKSFNVIPGSLGDLAIVTWFWPQNRPFLTPPCPREKDGRGQSGPNSCFPINIDVIWGVQEFPRWFQGSWVTLPLWPDFDLKISHFWPPRAHGRRMAGVKEALNYVFLLIQMWFEALKSFYFNSRVPGRPCHCYLKSAIFDPLCPREKDGRGQSGPKSCFPVNIEVIRGDKEFPRWFQAPCLTLPLWPDFDLKISHFWSPRAQTGRVAGVKAALYHVFPLI